jgi:hypothetical protein
MKRGYDDHVGLYKYIEEMFSMERKSETYTWISPVRCNLLLGGICASKGPEEAR